MSPLNDFGTDRNNAHTQLDGTYHYHGNPMAMFQTNCESTATGSPVIGFAADGFPIYGSCFDDGGTVRKARSSYVLKSGDGPRQDVDGQYGYYITDEFPWTLACFSCNPDGSFYRLHPDRILGDSKYY